MKTQPHSSDAGAERTLSDSGGARAIDSGAIDHKRVFRRPGVPAFASADADDSADEESSFKKRAASGCVLGMLSGSVFSA